MDENQIKNEKIFYQNQNNENLEEQGKINIKYLEKLAWKESSNEE